MWSASKCSRRCTEAGRPQSRGMSGMGMRARVPALHSMGQKCPATSRYRLAACLLALSLSLFLEQNHPNKSALFGEASKPHCAHCFSGALEVGFLCCPPCQKGEFRHRPEGSVMRVHLCDLSSGHWLGSGVCELTSVCLPHSVSTQGHGAAHATEAREVTLHRGDLEPSEGDPARRDLCVHPGDALKLLGDEMELGCSWETARMR